MNPGPCYQIHVTGRLDPSWSEWLDGMEITPLANDETSLAGTLADQAALRGVLEKLFDLNLPLVALSRIDPVATNGG
jgi:hypothetical protein